MKRTYSYLIIILVFALNLQAQNDTMYIMKDGIVINKYNVEDQLDSVIFYNPEFPIDFRDPYIGLYACEKEIGSTELCRDTIKYDTVEITKSENIGELTISINSTSVLFDLKYLSFEGYRIDGYFKGQDSIYIWKMCVADVDPFILYRGKKID